MTDRIRTLTVVLDHDARTDDDAQTVATAIHMIKGVERVLIGPAVTVPDLIARDVAASELQRKIFEMLEAEKIQDRIDRTRR